MNPIAAVIAIGDELTSGHRIDTNSSWISDQLLSIGIPVHLHVTVGDDLDQCVSAIRYASSRCSLICTTGGLGPTADDITRQAISAASGRQLTLDEVALTHLRAIFARRGRTMTDNNRVQAMFPAGSNIIPNPHGTAPGIDLTCWIDGRNVRLLAVPGVPAEAQEMFAQTVLSRLSPGPGDQQLIRAYTLKCFGPGESELESMLGDLTARGRDPLVGITVHQATISLRISVRGRSDAECRTAAAPTIELIRQRLGRVVFGEDGDELQHVVQRMLLEQRRTLAVGDAYSRGLLSQWLAECDPQESVFKGALVSGSGQGLAQLLDGVDANRAASVAASAVVGRPAVAAEPLARRLRKLWCTDYALVITTSPSRDNADSSTANNLEVGLAGPLTSATNHVSPGGHPEIHLARGAKFALNLLRQRYSEL